MAILDEFEVELGNLHDEIHSELDPMGEYDSPHILEKWSKRDRKRCWECIRKYAGDTDGEKVRRAGEWITKYFVAKFRDVTTDGTTNRTYTLGAPPESPEEEVEFTGNNLLILVVKGQIA